MGEYKMSSLGSTRRHHDNHEMTSTVDIQIPAPTPPPTIISKKSSPNLDRQYIIMAIP